MTKPGIHVYLTSFTFSLHYAVCSTLQALLKLPNTMLWVALDRRQVMRNDANIKKKKWFIMSDREMPYLVTSDLHSCSTKPYLLPTFSTLKQDGVGRSSLSRELKYTRDVPRIAECYIHYRSISKKNGLHVFMGTKFQLRYSERRALSDKNLRDSAPFRRPAAW